MPKIAATLVAAVLAVACGDSGPPDPPGPPPADQIVTTGVWTLESGKGPSGRIAVQSGHDITLKLGDDGNANGSAGCNSYGGGVSIDGRSFDAGGFAVSEIACEPAVTEAEERYLDAIAAADTIDVTGSMLTLTGPDTELVFELVPPMDPERLTDTTWILESLVRGDAVSSTLAAAEPAHVLLQPDGSFEGTTGCRRFTGSWTISGDVVDVTQMVFSGTCKRAAEQDAHVAAVLGGGFRAEFEQDLLMLTSDKGDLGLVYRAR